MVLHDDIRVVIVGQCPQTLDIVYTLALLQEDMADAHWKCVSRRDQTSSSRFIFNNALPLPPLPDTATKGGDTIAPSPLAKSTDENG